MTRHSEKKIAARAKFRDKLFQSCGGFFNQNGHVF